MKLNLGCGKDIKEGYVNCDIYPFTDKVRKVDFNSTLPFATDSIEEIYMAHALEHAKDVDYTMRELYRILKYGGILKIKVPHWSHYGAYQTFHKTFFQYWALDQYCEKNNVANFKMANRRFNLLGEDWKNMQIIAKPLGWIYNKYPHLAELFLCKFYPIREIYFEMIKV
jgi:predicted SAM-dependent methyltransferase